VSKRVCSVDDCGGEHAARGYCKKHYQRVRKYGETGLKVTDYTLFGTFSDPSRIASYPDGTIYAWHPSSTP
jgi:DNA-binding beta-propeller fold protein YncE